MKKKKIFLLCVVAFTTTLLIKTRPFVSNIQDGKSLLIQNVEAMSQNEEPYPEDRKKCIDEGGSWNMATTCEESGFEYVTCKVSGEISLFNVTIKGSYEKRKKYHIAWARYKCTFIPGNCCKKQGLYTGEQKLA